LFEKTNGIWQTFKCNYKLRIFFWEGWNKNKKRSQVSIYSNSLNPLNQRSSMVGTYRILGKHSRRMKIIEDKPTKYAIKLLVILLPMLIVPMASYDFLIFYFKHYTVIYSSMIVGFMIGVIILLVSDKIPRLFIQSTPKISNST